MGVNREHKVTAMVFRIGLYCVRHLNATKALPGCRLVTGFLLGSFPP